MDQNDTQKKQPKLTIKMLLDHACSNPDDFEHWEQWHNEHKSAMDYVPYPGYSRYTISLHCREVTVIARKLPNGGYHIKDMLWQDH